MRSRGWTRKIDGIAERLDNKIDAVAQNVTAAEGRLAERIAREIQDRPVVVHIDMSRVT